MEFMYVNYYHHMGDGDCYYLTKGMHCPNLSDSSMLIPTWEAFEAAS